MRILMVTPRFFPEVGGVETHVAEVSRRLVARGHEVTVLCVDLTGRLPLTEEWQGATIERVRGWPRRADYRLAPGIRQAVGRGTWDVVHVQSYHTFVAPLAMSAARAAALPYVITFHGGGHSSRLRNAARRPQLLALRPLLRDAARLIAVAEFEIDRYSRLLRLPREQFTLIPNGADLPAVRSGPTTPRGPSIASIGRLERYKGHQHAIAALPRVLAARPDASLWIAGSGKYERKLRALAERLGVTGAVEIRAIPPDHRGQMADRLSRTAVVVLLSSFETHPVAALEAAALGCHVVVADSDGLRELAERGLARRVEHPEDAAALATVLLEELAAPPVEHAVELPSWDDCAARLLSLYESVAGSRP
jgi:glycogen synthase